MDKRVATVIALMNDDLHRALSLSKMARTVNLSPSRFHYLFTTEIRMPPARYLKLVRMQAAKELLETTFLSVKEIVARAGFNDESHFVRNFKKLYGATPSEYRARTAGVSNQRRDFAPFQPTRSLANEQ